MNDLQTLIKLLEKHRTNFRDNVGLPTNKKSRIYRLVEGFRTGKFIDDDAAAQDIYGTDAKHINYKRLKYRLQDRLLHSLFLIDPEKVFANEANQDYYKVYQESVICSLLMRMKQNSVSVKLAKRYMKKAEQTNNPYAALTFSRLLRTDCMRNVDPKGHAYYNEKVHYYTAYIEAELMADEYYQLYNLGTKNKKLERDEMRKIAAGFVKNLMAIQVNYSPRFLFLKYFVVALDRVLNNDFEGVKDICAVVLPQLERTAQGRLYVHIFYLLTVEMHILQKQFTEGERMILRILKSQKHIPHNIFAVLTAYGTLCLNTSNYQHLGKVLQLFEDYGIKKTKLQKHKEDFLLLEVFYFILIKLEKMTTTYPAKEKIRIPKFINNLPVYSKDKYGKNTTILFIHFLLLLQKNQYAKIIDRVDALIMYNQRYLRKDENFRISCFLKMILLIPKNQFNPVAVRRKAQPFLEKLNTNPSQKLDWRSINIELIPYEAYWELFIEILEKNHRNN